MDKDDIIKQLTDQVSTLQFKVKSYAKLGELYENARSELHQFRLHHTVSGPGPPTTSGPGPPSPALRSSIPDPRSPTPSHELSAHGPRSQTPPSHELSAHGPRSHTSDREQSAHGPRSHTSDHEQSAPDQRLLPSVSHELPALGSETKLPAAGSPATPGLAYWPAGSGLVVSVCRPSDDITSLSNTFDTAIHSDAKPVSSAPQLHSPPMLNDDSNSKNVEALNAKQSMSAPASIRTTDDTDSFQQIPETGMVSIETRSFQQIPEDGEVSLQPQSSPIASRLTALADDAKRLELLLTKKTTEMDEKNKQIAALSHEVQLLKEQLQHVQGNASNQSTQTSARSGDEWVKVTTCDKATSRQTSTVSSERTSSEELAGMEAMLEKKVAELTSTIRELKAANKSWEQHLKKINEENFDKFRVMRTESDTMRLQLAESKRREDIRQAECERMVTAAQRRALDAETSKERALGEVASLKRQCDQAEATLAQYQRESKTRVEKRYREMEILIQGQKEYINKLETQVMGQSRIVSTQLLGGGAGGGANASEPGREISMPTEVMLLHQQIALWKEDFEKERADREKAQSELETMRKVSMEDRQMLHKERDLSRQRKDKLEQAEREKRDLLAKLNEKTAELQQLKLKSTIGQTRTSPPTVRKQWNCMKCTFINSVDDRFCLMCGNKTWLQPTIASALLEHSGASAPHRRCPHHHHVTSGQDTCDCEGSVVSDGLYRD